ncbi:MAG: hypothetical protein V7642_6613 [Burkholderiales bacterium]
MAYTVIGVYDNYSDAEEALKELVSRGIPRHKMNLGLIEDSPLGRRAELQQLTQSDDESTSRLSLPDFMRTFFGNGRQDRDIYLEAVRRGSYVLMVNAENDKQADQAMHVMAGHHPVNIDERASQWRSRGWDHYDPSASVMTDAEIDHERSLLPETTPSIPIQQVQGDPVKDAAAKPAGETIEGLMGEAQRLGISRLNEEAQRLGVRLYQRGF